MRRQTLKFYFSVEGETEKWYLEWLQRTINHAPEASFNACFDCRIEKDPLKRARGLNILVKTEIAHIFDRESEEEVHTEKFITVLNRMSEAEKMGKRINYILGYSNFSFELWMILHKMECNGALAHRRQYLPILNHAFNENFESLDIYKREDNFKRILGQLDIGNVRQAVRYANNITRANENNGYPLHQYKGFTYYTENPSLSVGIIVEDILSKCGLHP
jgi:hypothetical protein